MSSGGPDEWGVGAVGVVAVGVAPGVDKVVGRTVGINHGGFGFEVPFCGGSDGYGERAKQIGEESLAGGGVTSGGAVAGWIN